MHEVIETILNDGGAERTIVIEPWGMPVRLEAEHTLTLVARAPTVGQLEIVKEADAVIVYAWPTSTVDVFDGDLLVHQFATPVPAVPRNQSVKRFLGLVLGREPNAD